MAARPNLREWTDGRVHRLKAGIAIAASGYAPHRTGDCMSGNQHAGISVVRERVRGSRGITLADLSVTLTAFAILLLAFVPILSRLLDMYHLRGAAQQIFAELQHARLT